MKNPNHKSDYFFPTWYKIVELTPTQELVTNRIAGIKSIISDYDVDFWLDVVRTALGSKVKDEEFTNNFVESFRKTDIGFPVSSNENVVRTLAQISLCFLFESNEDFRFAIALALMNSTFYSQEAYAVPFIHYAQNYVIDYNNYTSDIKHNDLDLLVDRKSDIENEEETLNSTDTVNLIDALITFKDINDRLSNEVNVLWWLFGQYSYELEDYFTNINTIELILPASIELYDLNGSKQSLASSKHILHKVLTTSKARKPKLNEYSLEEVFLQTDSAIRNKILKLGEESGFTPVLYSLGYYDKFEEKNLWQTAVKKELGSIDLDKKFPSYEISFQVYKEIMLIRILQDLENE